MNNPEAFKEDEVRSIKFIVPEETAVVPGKMEFRLINPTESNFLKHIEWNKEELLAAVRSKVTSYIFRIMILK